MDTYINMYNDDPTLLSPTHTARILGDQLRFDPAPVPIRVEEISWGNCFTS